MSSLYAPTTRSNGLTVLSSSVSSADLAMGISARASRAEAG